MNYPDDVPVCTSASTTDLRLDSSRTGNEIAALALVPQWLNYPEFESIRPHIQTMHRRLTAFVGQVGK